MTEPDSELMERYRDGDEDAFRLIVQRFQRPLINFFFRLTWDRFAAEDYAQEVFVRLIRHRANYRPTAKFSTYLFRIAKNYWIDRYRERATSPRPASLEATVGGEDGDGPSLRNTVASDLPGAEELLDRKEIRRRVREALLLLPEEQRLVFVLSENQGLRYSDIAQVMEIPVGTVKSRMHAAVLRLRELLKDMAHGTS
jgi:RNA polymerase sigma-70 factor (ECF subfamily)